VAEANPTSVDVLLQMGNYWKLRNDYARAEEFFLRVIQMEPKNLGLSERLVDFYIENNNHEKARETLETLLEREQKSRSLRKLFVEVCLAQNRMEEARAALEALARAGENDVELQMLQGEYHLLAMEPTHAISYFRGVVEEEPNLPVVHYVLGLAYLAGSMNQLAQQSFVQAIALDSEFSEAEMALAGLYYKQEEYDLSFEYARRVCEREPGNSRGYMIMGNVFLAQGQYEEAEACFMAVEGLDPEAIAPHYYRALTAEMSHEVEESLRLYQELLEKTPNLVDVAQRYARLLIKTGKSNEAEQYFRDALKKAPENGYRHHILGEICFSQEKKEDAKAEFQEAIRLESKLVSSYLRLASIYEEEGDYDNQLRVLEGCVENVRDYPDVYMRLSRAYEQKGFVEKATETLEKGVAMNEDSPLLANNLAWLYLELDRNMNKAMELAQFAYDRLPKDPAVVDTLAWAFYKQGIYTRAQWLLDEARSLDPENPVIYFHLGMVYDARGEKGRAMEMLEKAISLGLDGKERDEAERMMKVLRQKQEKG
jgi:tetratricopeptide (TPR) repeat protein